MRRAVAGVWDVPAEGGGPALTAIGICFFLGSAAGCLLAAAAKGSGGESLTAYIQGFLSAAGEGSVQPPALLPLIWELLRWPIFTIALSFTALGILGIPILFSVRGFLLSFAVSSFVRMFGSEGCFAAALIFGVSGAVSIPALFVLGAQGLAASARLARRTMGESRRDSPFGRAYFLRCGMCAGAFCVCILLEYLAVPTLVAWAAGILVA